MRSALSLPHLGQCNNENCFWGSKEGGGGGISSFFNLKCIQHGGHRESGLFLFGSAGQA